MGSGVNVDDSQGNSLLIVHHCAATSATSVLLVGQGIFSDSDGGVWYIVYKVDARESVEQLSIFKKIERRPMAWPCQLTIGSGITINIVGYKAMTEEKVKKSWTSVDAKTLRKEDVRRETVYCLNDDDETEVSKEDTIQ
eukprot:g38995.t1